MSYMCDCVFLSSLSPNVKIMCNVVGEILRLSAN
jgi:hypothetical protein